MVEVRYRQSAKLSREVLISQLKGYLEGRVYQAFLFGSQALGRASQQSDIDLMLIADTTRPWTERWQDFSDLLDRFGPVDLLVYTPDEWSAIEREPTPFFRQARRERVRVV